jgi:hypothetical protein
VRRPSPLPGARRVGRPIPQARLCRAATRSQHRVSAEIGLSGKIETVEVQALQKFDKRLVAPKSKGAKPIEFFRRDDDNGIATTNRHALRSVAASATHP